MYKRKTATYKKLAHYGKTVMNGLFSSCPIFSSQMEILMVNDEQERRNENKVH